MTLDEESRRRIEEEERVRAEARAKAEAGLIQSKKEAGTGRTKKTCLGCLIAFVVVVALLFTLRNNSYERGMDERRPVARDQRRAGPAPSRAVRKVLVPIKAVDAFRTLEEAGWRRSDRSLQRQDPELYANEEWHKLAYEQGHELEGYTVTIHVVCDGSSSDTASVVKKANFLLLSTSRFKALNRERKGLIQSLFGTPAQDSMGERVNQLNKQSSLSEADAFHKARLELDVFMQVFGHGVTSDRVLEAVGAEADRVRGRPLDFPDAKGIYIKEVIVNATAPRVVAGAGCAGSNVEILLHQ